MTIYYIKNSNQYIFKLAGICDQISSNYKNLYRNFCKKINSFKNYEMKHDNISFILIKSI